MQSPADTRRHFTQAARDAALARRREIAASPKDPRGALDLFIVRGAESGIDFGWEVRRFGAIVVARSGGGYPTAALARQAGEGAVDGALHGGGPAPARTDRPSPLAAAPRRVHAAG